MKNWKFRKIHHDILILIVHFCILMMLKNTITKMHGEDPQQSTGFIGKTGKKLQERNIHVTKRISLSKNPSPDSIAYVGIAGQLILYCSAHWHSDQ